MATTRCLQPSGRLRVRGLARFAGVRLLAFPLRIHAADQCYRLAVSSAVRATLPGGTRHRLSIPRLGSAAGLFTSNANR